MPATNFIQKGKAEKRKRMPKQERKKNLQSHSICSLPHQFLLSATACSQMQSRRRNRNSQSSLYLLPSTILPNENRAAHKAGIFYFPHHIAFQKSKIIYPPHHINVKSTHQVSFNLHTSITSSKSSILLRNDFLSSCLNW